MSPEQRAKHENLNPIIPGFGREYNRTYAIGISSDIDNGLLLEWLIDTKNKKVEIYRPNQPIEVVDNPTSLSGEDVLPGFVLDLQVVFS